MPYDPTTTIGQVRLLAFDRGASPLFTDDEIQVFLDLNAQTVRLAAAQALEFLAGNEAYLLKHMSTHDVMTDGSTEANALLEVASRYRQVEYTQGTDFGLFGHAEMINNGFQMRERILKQFQREAG